jgi:TRAP-type C4-dicarboxylate transport system substrate-binding protein
MGFVSGCITVSQRAYDSLPNEQRDVLRAAAAKAQQRFEDLGRQQDEALLHGGLFVKQGLTVVPVAPELKDAYERAALLARTQLADKLVPHAQLQRAQQLLEDYRRHK